MGFRDARRVAFGWDVEQGSPWSGSERVPCEATCNTFVATCLADAALAFRRDIEAADRNACEVTKWALFVSVLVVLVFFSCIACAMRLTNTLIVVTSSCLGTMFDGLVENGQGLDLH